MTTTDETRTRPRVEGEREDEILDATLVVLADVGYDRLTMDAVAHVAKASKATLYRRWSTKAELVVDAVTRARRCTPPGVIDTGSLRADLLALATCAGGLTDDVPVSLTSAIVTAMQHNDALRAAFHERFLQPRIGVVRAAFERAQARGEIPAEVDVDDLWEIVPALVVHRVCFLGERPTAAMVERIVDRVVLPAAGLASGR